MKMPNLASLYQSGTSYFCQDCQSARYGPLLAPRRTSPRIALRAESYFELARCQVASIFSASSELVGRACCDVCAAKEIAATLPASKRNQNRKRLVCCNIGMAQAPAGF